MGCGISKSESLHSERRADKVASTLAGEACLIGAANLVMLGWLGSTIRSGAGGVAVVSLGSVGGDGSSGMAVP